MRPFCNVQTVKKNTRKFRWENYARDFENDQNDVEKLYWTCVISDILKNYRDDFSSGYVRWLNVRLFKTFLGCFYKAHEIHHALLEKFECLPKIKRDEDDVYWQAWIDQLQREKQDALTIIMNVVVSNYTSQQFIKTINPVQLYSVDTFDDLHKYLAQKVSSMIILHIRNGLLPNPVKGTRQAAFPFSVSADLISTLHQQGIVFTSRLMVIHAIRQVEKHFEKNNNPIKAYPRKSPSKALDDLLLQTPEFKSLSTSQLIYLIQTKYRDSQGHPLKNNSIRKALLRQGYSL